MKLTLKQARLLAGITQEDAGKLVGVGRDTIASWEMERSYPDIISFRKLCKAYHVKTDDVIFLPKRSA